MIPTMNDEWWMVNGEWWSQMPCCCRTLWTKRPLWPAWRHLSQALIVALTVISLGRFERLGDTDHELQHETHFITNRFISIHLFGFMIHIKCGYWTYSVTDQHFMRFQHLIVFSTLHGTSTSSPEDARPASIVDLKSLKNLWQRNKNHLHLCGWSGMVWDGLKQCYFLLWILHASFWKSIGDQSVTGIHPVLLQTVSIIF